MQVMQSLPTSYIFGAQSIEIFSIINLYLVFITLLTYWSTWAIIITGKDWTRHQVNRHFFFLNFPWSWNRSNTFPLKANYFHSRWIWRPIPDILLEAFLVIFLEKGWILFLYGTKIQFLNILFLLYYS